MGFAHRICRDQFNQKQAMCQGTPVSGTRSGSTTSALVPPASHADESDVELKARFEARLESSSVHSEQFYGPWIDSRGQAVHVSNDVQQRLRATLTTSRGH